MKYIVIGCGSIGRRHIKNLQDIGERDIYGIDINEEYRVWVENNLHINTYSDSEMAIIKEKPDVVLICTPPFNHIQLANIAVENNAHVFIEKPLSNNLDGVEELVRKVVKKGVKAMVGYNQRFNEVLIKAKQLVEEEEVLYARILGGQYLPDWRPWQDYRKSYTAKKSSGGGIILDGSHEFDYVRWMFGEPDKLVAFGDKLSSLDVETEDTVEVLMRIRKMIINVHLDFIRRGYVRTGEAISLKKTIQWNLGDNTIVIYHGDEKRIETINIRQEINETYVREIKNFIDTIRNDGYSAITLEDGTKTLKLALKIKEAAGVL